MRILREYTIDFIKRNKRSTIAIIISIIISTTLITALSSIIYNMQMDEIRMLKEKQGNWHGELFDEVKGENLKYVLAHPNVETAMIKGPWQLGKLTDQDSKRPYLILQDLTQEYFSSIISEAIIEGRMAQTSSELVVSELFFKENPQYQLGSFIDLPMGARNHNGENIDVLSPYFDSETFIEESTRTYEIVGISDTKTNSVTPGYYAMGFMDIDTIQEDDDLTIYLKFKNPRSIYTDLPQIAQSVGLEKNEYGNYSLKYNTSLLGKYLIFPKTTFSIQTIFNNFSLYSFIWGLLFVAILVVLLFVLIIHAAFSISTNSRIKQLGMLKSIGATPNQIKMSVLFEDFLLSIISLPVGIMLGHLLSINYIKIANKLNESLMNSLAIFQFSWLVVFISVLLALITVWFSALIPIRKLNKLRPIEAIKYSGNIKLKKTKKNVLFSKFFGITGELAVNSFVANKKAYITSLVSMIISFILLVSFLNLFDGMNKAQKEIYGMSEYWELRDITFRLMDGNPLDSSLEEQVREIEHIENIMFYSDTAGSVWVDAEKESKETSDVLSFEKAAQTNNYPIYESEGKYRLRANIIGLDDSSFATYCNEIGADYKDFYHVNNKKYIVVNTQEDMISSTKRYPKYIPLLDIQAGESLAFSGNIRANDNESFEDNLQIGYITDKYPKTGEYISAFTVAIIMPMEIYENFVSNFSNEKATNSLFTSAIIKTDGNVAQPLKAIEDMLTEQYSLGDFNISNILTRNANQEKSQLMFRLVTYFLTSLLAIIGLSNTFSTVTNSMQVRKKEFAMLRSIGIAPKDFFKLFIYEALYFTFVPFLIGTSVSAIFIMLILKSNEIQLFEYVKYIPITPIAVYSLVILLSVLSIYIYNFKSIQKESIIEHLKIDLI